MVQVKEYLDKNYPVPERENITELDISNKGLQGKLVLKGFENLVKLDCSDNSISEIDFEELSWNFKTLKYLNLKNNCLISTSLEVFAAFTQLEELYLGTDNSLNILGRKYNRFYGSLKYLSSLIKLKKLCISNIDMVRGYEYLPDSLETLFFSDLREEVTGEDLNCIQTKKELKEIGGDLKKWKELKKKSVNNLQILNQVLVKRCKNLQEQVKNLEEELKEKEETIINLELESEDYRTANELIRKKYEKMVEVIRENNLELQANVLSKNLTNN